MRIVYHRFVTISRQNFSTDGQIRRLMMLVLPTRGGPVRIYAVLTMSLPSLSDYDISMSCLSPGISRSGVSLNRMVTWNISCERGQRVYGKPIIPRS